eukprot:g65204.t1
MSCWSRFCPWLFPCLPAQHTRSSTWDASFGVSGQSFPWWALHFLSVSVDAYAGARAGAFEVFVFAESWLPTLCQTNGCKSCAASLTPYSERNVIVHGLWGRGLHHALSASFEAMVRRRSDLPGRRLRHPLAQTMVRKYSLQAFSPFLSFDLGDHMVTDAMVKHESRSAPPGLAMWALSSDLLVKNFTICAKATSGADTAWVWSSLVLLAEGKVGGLGGPDEPQLLIGKRVKPQPRRKPRVRKSKRRGTH